MLKYILLGGKLMSSKELIKQLNKLGWQEVRIKGSHHQFKHPNKDYLITVPHPKRDLLGFGILIFSSSNTNK